MRDGSCLRLAPAPDLRPTGAALRDPLEISALGLECDGAPTNTGMVAGRPDFVDDLITSVISAVSMSIGKHDVETSGQGDRRLLSVSR
jgi:hypothetical protein